MTVSTGGRRHNPDSYLGLLGLAIEHRHDGIQRANATYRESIRKMKYLHACGSVLLKSL
jgi:hypothetical protein